MPGRKKLSLTDPKGWREPTAPVEVRQPPDAAEVVPTDVEASPVQPLLDPPAKSARRRRRPGAEPGGRYRHGRAPLER